MRTEIGTIRNRLGNTVCTAFLSDACARKNNVRVHTHTEFEVSLILTGAGTYDTLHGRETIGEYDIFIFGTNEQHCITDILPSAADSAMQLLNLHISPSFLWSAEDSVAPGDSFLQLIGNREILPTNKIPHDTPLAVKLFSLMTDIREEFAAARPDYAVMVKSRILEIFIMLYRDFATRASLPQNRRVYPVATDRFETAIAYMSAHFTQNITLSEIAAAAHLSRTYFCSTFKNFYGMTPWEYLTIKRIDNAKLLLKTTDKSILDIAGECGFNNSVNFIKAFRKYTNISPKAYRQR